MEWGLREEGCIRMSIAAAFAHIRNGRRIKGSPWSWAGNFFWQIYGHYATPWWINRFSHRFSNRFSKMY